MEQNAVDIDPRLLRDYQSLCGALLYCAVNTRPDVAFAVGMLLPLPRRLLAFCSDVISGSG